MRHELAICILTVAACGDSPLTPPPPVDQTCELHVSMLGAQPGAGYQGGWVKMGARVVYTCSRLGLYPASIRVFDGVDRTPFFFTDHSTYALCNEAVDFDFYVFPEDVTHLAVDAFMEVPPSAPPREEKGLYCESPEFPWRSDL
jgi:hypothetical protein